MDSLYNLNIERAILSSLIFDPYGDDAGYIISHTHADDYYLPFHQYVYTAINELIREEKPVDEEFVRGALIKGGHWDEVAMLDLLSATPVTNTRAYVGEMVALSQKRKLVTLATTIKKQILEDDEDALSTIDDTIRRAERIAEGGAVQISRKSMAYAEAKAPEFMVKDWLPIPKATTSMLVAPGGTGKTWVSLQLAVRMVREDAARKVFLWLSEDPEGIVKSRYDAVISDVLYGTKSTEDVQIDISTDDPVLMLDGRGSSVRLSPKFYAIKRELRAYDVIIIDPLLAFFGGDENDNSQARIFMQPFLNWARSENKAIIFIHHSKKGIAETGSRARGAGAIVDAVRCVYDIDKIYVKKSDGKEIDPQFVHAREFTLSKDNYGAIQYLDSFRVRRDITPRSSAPSYTVEYEVDETVGMPTI